MGNAVLKKILKERLKSTIVFILFIQAVIICIFGYPYLERKIIYPTKYKDEVIKYSKEFNISPFIIFSTIKIESGFNVNAISVKNAKGLMQITDKTANYIAQNLKITSFDIFNPDTNIRFGSYYLRYLMDKFNNLETAIASYNAGEGNVSLWLKNSNYSDDQITLKAIPFTETSNYVKKFCKSYEKYRKLYENILDKNK